LPWRQPVKLLPRGNSQTLEFAATRHCGVFYVNDPALLTLF